MHEIMFQIVSNIAMEEMGVICHVYRPYNILYIYINIYMSYIYHDKAIVKPSLKKHVNLPEINHLGC